MIIISNYTNRIGPDFSVNLRHVHPALLENAFSFENYEESEVETTGAYKKYITVPGTYYAPPREVVATMLASEWTLDLSLTFGSAALSESGKLLKYSQDGDEGDNNPDDDIKTINDRMRVVAGPITFSDFNYSGEDSISFEINIGDWTGIQWDWTLKKWTVPITMSISCGNNPEDVEEEGALGAFGLGRKTTPFGSALSGVPINLFGSQYYAYDLIEEGSDAFPTGSITLTAVKYLPLAVPP